MNDNGFEHVLEEVLARSNERRRGTVRALVQILNQMASRGVKAFTIVAVGRECEAVNVLKTQTIRNANGEDFRRLIEAFALARGASTNHRPVQHLTPLQEAIASIPDLDIRTRLNAMLAENRAQRAEIQALRQGFAKLQAPQPEPSHSAESSPFEVEILPPRKSDINLGPLERFASADWIDDQAWTIGESGALYNGNAMISPAGFVPTLRAVIEYVRNTQCRRSRE
ncbi:gamma-mobile-trio protein GmtX [Magnetospirillum sulfuroxidans]|uniref:Uncharacterized protein n=1 Tax=Magnetospirillum sulfuroxidans TaxID=611300 RepID=A0ABS5IBK5_9PROT|nr:gamma-mobile-trio protein GmtX [Magnetospirillum sulfuroxidans]MBR9971812.1 hypothetical protein [Magnetospirillum sulfuroxidans]